eukprot:Skav213389  [mRNA]  locus=scaffold797:387756:390023:+ [translate_table: standard]
MSAGWNPPQLGLVLLPHVVSGEAKSRCCIECAPLDGRTQTQNVVHLQAKFGHPPDGHQLVGKHIHLYMVRAVDWNSTPRTGGKNEGSDERRVDQVDHIPGMST